MLFGCYGKNFGFYPVNIGKALKNFEQEINIYLFIFWEDFFFNLPVEDEGRKTN